MTGIPNAPETSETGILAIAHILAFVQVESLVVHIRRPDSFPTIDKTARRCVRPHAFTNLVAVPKVDRRKRVARGRTASDDLATIGIAAVVQVDVFVAEHLPELGSTGNGKSALVLDVASGTNGLTTASSERQRKRKEGIAEGRKHEA